MDLEKLLQQSQNIQKDLEALQQELQKENFVGSFQGVEVALNAQLEVVHVKIDPSLLAEKDAGLLEDLFTLAINKAIQEALKASLERLKDKL